MLLIGVGGGVVDGGGFILLDRIWRSDNAPLMKKALRAAQMERMSQITTKFSFMHVFFAAGAFAASAGIFIMARAAQETNGNYNWYLQGLGIFVLAFSVLVFFLRIPFEIPE